MEQKKGIFLATIASISILSGCVGETSRVIPVEQVKASSSIYSGERALVSIGKFSNRTNYHSGVFSDGEDRLGNQAKSILTSHLHQSNRFSVLDRENISEMKQESGFSANNLDTKGAKYIITGGVTEFGRKNIGDKQLFGLLGKGKSQIAYARVTITVIDVTTSSVVYSANGAGEYQLSSREVIGFGGTAGYDSTLNGKVLDLAIRDAVDELATAMDNKIWKP